MESNYYIYVQQWQYSKITTAETCLLGIIQAFSSKSGVCFAGNLTLSNAMPLNQSGSNYSTRSIQRMLKMLSEKDLINIDFNDNKRQIFIKAIASPMGSVAPVKSDDYFDQNFKDLLPELEIENSKELSEIINLYCKKLKRLKKLDLESMKLSFEKYKGNSAWLIEDIEVAYFGGYSTFYYSDRFARREKGESALDRNQENENTWQNLLKFASKGYNYDILSNRIEVSKSLPEPIKLKLLEGIKSIGWNNIRKADPYHQKQYKKTLFTYLNK